MEWSTEASRCTSIPEREAVVKLPTRRNMSPIRGIDKKQFGLRSRCWGLISECQNCCSMNRYVAAHYWPCAFTKEHNYMHTSQAVKYYDYPFRRNIAGCLPKMQLYLFSFCYRDRIGHLQTNPDLHVHIYCELTWFTCCKQHS